MKKTTKLLSVILAFVMALSCMTMMASAAKTSYQTVENLKSLDAYSPYGTVTRLSTEERVSILLDSLDILLGKANINMGTVLDTLGLKITINLTSVDNLCASFDSFKTTTSKFAFKFAKALLNLGILEEVDFTNWEAGMSRDGTAQLTIVEEILELLSSNSNLVNTVLTSGLELGMIKNFLTGVSMVGINNLVTNLPGAIKGIALPMMGRQDDDQAQRDKLGNRNTDLLTTAQEFVNGLFTKPMSWTSYRVDAAGNDLGYTTALPTQASGTSRYFVNNGDGTITQFDYQYEGLLGDPEAGFVETVTYTKAKEYDTEDCNSYVYRAPAGYDGDQTLKWYKAEGKVDDNGNIQSGYWLPSVKEAMENGTLTLNINGNDSLLGLLYKFAPYIFREMAPTILNGSAKKLIAEAFDVEFTKIGLKGSAEVAAEASATGNPDSFFTKAQEYYTWEYSDYKVIDGVPYYRFQDTYFKGEIPKNISAYYSMFNWNWNISDDFMDEFIPTTVGSTWALDGLNNLVKKAIDTMIADSWTVKGTTYTRAEVFNWEAGDNSKLLNNLMVCARNFFNIAPEEIVDEYFKEAQFYDAMMNGTLSQAVNGLVCELVKLIMPQIVFDDNIVNQPITAIAAVVVRELCTQLMPTYNFDAMIYSNYGNASNTKRTLASHTADEWLDITLYMGVNLGMYYLRNIADIGEDSDLGYYSVMANLGALPAIATAKKNTTAAGDAITFAANSYKATDGTPSWLVAVDWIVDWALDVNTEWCWHFERLVTVDGTVDLATYQNPFKKINSVLITFIPELENLFNTTGLAGTDYGSGTLVEKILKDGLVDSIVNLDVTTLLGMFKIPEASALRKNNIADTLVQMIVNFLNKVTLKVCGGANLINTSSINSVNSLLNHANLRTLIVNLVGKLYNASNKYHIFDPLMPLVNFFVGWTVDPQKYAEPSLYFSNSWGSTYLYTNAADTNSPTNDPVLKFTNSSSGMLLQHRNSTVDDTAYTITVTNVTFDAGVSSTQSFPLAVAPGQTAEIALTLPADTSTVVEATVTYYYTGKDGAKLGGNQTKTVYGYVSAVKDQLNEKVAGVDKDYTQNGDYKSYEFTEDIYDSIVNYTAVINYKSDATGAGALFNSSKSCNSVGTNGANVTAPASNYFQHITSVSEAGFTTVYKDDTAAKPSSSSGRLYKAKSGVTANTDFPYGVYDMGTTTVKYGSSGKDYTIDFIYYNDYDISSVYDKYTGYNLQERDFKNATAWNTYEVALKKVVELALVAKRTDYVETVQPQIEAAIEALENAYEALMKSGTTAASAGDVSKVETKLNKLETNPDRDINFQDYALFEYFKYESERTNARNMVKSTVAPSLPENYIENGVWGNDLINAIVDAQTSANVKAGINGTVVEPTEEEMAKARQEIADFIPAEYTDLAIDDQEAKLQYYYNFMAANTKTIDKTFLNQEITYAEAQNYVADKYSADSWSRYTEALAKAKDAAANSAKESEIFDAKYELMVAQNKLQLKERSMKEVGYMNEELIPLIQAANAIIDNFGTLYTTKSNISDADAFAQLVRALGIDYDVEIDGKEYSGILYDRSALTFAEYDRTATAKNKRTIDVAADKLREAIENFECTAKLEAANGTQVEVEQDVRYVKGVHPNSVPSKEALLAKVNVTGATGAVAEVTVSKSGHYGTGTRIDVVKGDHLLASYFVVIDGDVNGDGAVDAFDAIEVDIANTTAYYMGDVYDDAADLNNDGIVDAADYSSLTTLVMCK